MPYLNLDDNFADHPKVDRLSDAAFRLHISGMLYAAKHLTDGAIPADRPPRLKPRYKASTLAELVKGSLWLPTDDGFEIHDYLDWNKSREQITTERERIRQVRSEAGRKGAQAKWQRS